MAAERRARAGAAFLAYLILTLWLTYPVAARIGSGLPSDPGDPVLNTWILWWNSQTLPLTHAWWQAPAFYPATGVFAFSEHLLGLAWISVPVQWATGNPVVAYNVAFLLSFALSGLASYLLVFELTGRRDAAWVGGALYAFCAYRIDQLPHLQVLSSYWMPLALFALHRYRADPRPRWLALLAGAVVLQGLSNGYFLLFFPVLLALWFVWFMPSAWSWRKVRGLAIAGAAAALLVLPVLWQYRVIQGYYGFSRSAGELAGYGADLTSLLSAPGRLRLWHGLELSDRGEGHLFPGITAPLLVFAALVCLRRVPRESGPRVVRMARRVILALAAIYGTLLLSRLIIGPWAVRLPGLSVSVGRLDKLFSENLLFLSLLWLLSPWVVSAWRRASPFPFYVMAAVGMWILALGPSPTFMDRPALYKAPYEWLMLLPGYTGLRVPARFWMLAVVCLSTAGGLAYARLVGERRRWTWAAAALVTAASLSDTWVGPMPVVDAPPRSPILEEHAEYPVIEFPIDLWSDLAAMYRATFHHQPLANGYSGYEAPHYPALKAALALKEPALLTRLSAMGIRDVRVDRRADRDGDIARFVAAYPRVETLGQSEEEVVFRLPPAPPESLEPALGAPLVVASLHASVHPEQLRSLLDHDRETRWETGPQHPGEWLLIDLAEPRPVGAIVLSLGPNAGDFPRLLSIEISTDGDDWREVVRTPTADRVITASLRDPVMLPLEISLGGREARYLRLTQLGEDPEKYWSVAELQIFAPSD